MSTLRKYVETLPRIEVDVALFESLHDNMSKLGSQFIGSESRMFAFINILETYHRRPGKLDGLLKSFQGSDGNTLYVGKLSVPEKEAVLDEVLSTFKTYMNELSNIPSEHELLKSMSLMEAKNYFFENIVLSHRFIFSDEFSNFVKEDKDLGNSFSCVVSSRDAIHVATSYMCYSLFNKALKGNFGDNSINPSDVISLSFTKINSAIFLYQYKSGFAFNTILAQWVNAAVHEFFTLRQVVKGRSPSTISSYSHTMDDSDSDSHHEAGIDIDDAICHTNNTVAQELILDEDLRAYIEKSVLTGEEAELALYFYQGKVERNTMMQSLNLDKKAMESMLGKWQRAIFSGTSSMSNPTL